MKLLDHCTINYLFIIFLYQNTSGQPNFTPVSCVNYDTIQFVFHPNQARNSFTRLILISAISTRWYNIFPIFFQDNFYDKHESRPILLLDSP